MSQILESALDADRRAECARNDAAMAHGITQTSLDHVAGKHLSEAPNSPFFAEDELIAADLARDDNKGERLARLNAARAFALQMVDLDAMRRAGL